jgi:hypothetical protein
MPHDKPLRPDDVIDIRTAAELLGIRQEQVGVMIEDGLLHPLDGQDEPTLQMAEVMALRSQGG